LPREKRRAYPTDGPSRSIHEEPSMALQRKQTLPKEKVEDVMSEGSNAFPDQRQRFLPKEKKGPCPSQNKSRVTF